VNKDNEGDGNINAVTDVTRSEGKEPLSIELYKFLCGWLLDYGMSDGVFAFCYLVFTWNIACRVGNIARILFQDVTWAESFDSYLIFFAF
jgi:hypothetical protein